MIEGSCLCGGVGFEVDSLDGPIGHCHCRTCRKAHSAAFATTSRVTRDHFRWTRGIELVRGYESSPGKVRRFCSRCGSQLIAEWLEQPSVIVRVGALDDDPGGRPEGHIWISHDVPWLDPGIDLPAFTEGAPGSRTTDSG